VLFCIFCLDTGADVIDDTEGGGGAGAGVGAGVDDVAGFTNEVEDEVFVF
jgi:hypothetical protein